MSDERPKKDNAAYAEAITAVTAWITATESLDSETWENGLPYGEVFSAFLDADEDFSRWLGESYNHAPEWMDLIEERGICPGGFAQDAVRLIGPTVRRIIRPRCYLEPMIMNERPESMLRRYARALHGERESVTALDDLIPEEVVAAVRRRMFLKNAYLAALSEGELYGWGRRELPSPPDRARADIQRTWWQDPQVFGDFSGSCLYWLAQNARAPSLAYSEVCVRTLGLCPRNSVHCTGANSNPSNR